MLDLEILSGLSWVFIIELGSEIPASSELRNCQIYTFYFYFFISCSPDICSIPSSGPIVTHSLLWEDFRVILGRLFGLSVSYFEHRCIGLSTSYIIKWLYYSIYLYGVFRLFVHCYNFQLLCFCITAFFLLGYYKKYASLDMTNFLLTSS